MKEEREETWEARKEELGEDRIWIILQLGLQLSIASLYMLVTSKIPVNPMPSPQQIPHQQSATDTHVSVYPLLVRFCQNGLINLGLAHGLATNLKVLKFCRKQNKRREGLCSVADPP